MGKNQNKAAKLLKIADAKMQKCGNGHAMKYIPDRVAKECFCDRCKKELTKASRYVSCETCDEDLCLECRESFDKNIPWCPNADHCEEKEATLICD
jgi:hypothetical protein